MKFLTSKKTNFCRVLGLTGKKSHLFCAILGYDTSESLTSRFVFLFWKKNDSKKNCKKKVFFFLGPSFSILFGYSTFDVTLFNIAKFQSLNLTWQCACALANGAVFP